MDADERRFRELRFRGSRNQASNERFAVVIERTESAYSPDVAGCAAVGDTEEETRRNFQEALAAHVEAIVAAGETLEETTELIRGAIRMHLADMLEDGEPIPSPGNKSSFPAS